MKTFFGIITIVAVYYILKWFDTEDTKKKEPQQPQEVSPKRRITIKVKSGPSHGVVKELKFFCIKDKGYHVSVWPKDVYIPDYIEFSIAGVNYRRDIAMKHLGETRGMLVAEPDNPHDANTIRVMTPDNQCVGYVPRDMTSEIRKHVTLPFPCYFYIGISNDDNPYIYTDAYINIEEINNKKVNNYQN